MQIPGLTLALERLPAPLPIWRGNVDADAWQVAARAVAASDGRLVALWGADCAWHEHGGFSVCAAYALARSLDLPLLFKGDDFVHTDIRSALA